MWICGYVDAYMPTMVRPVNDIVFIKSALVAPAIEYVNNPVLQKNSAQHPPARLPFKRKNIARRNRNRVRRLRVSEQIAAQINARQVLHRGAIIAGSDRAVIRRRPDTYTHERLVRTGEKEKRAG